jgi:hypothetical protein
MLQPEFSPWDHVFAENTEQWVRVRLKSGAYVGGLLKKGSATSAYPCPEQLYILHEWKLDSKTGEFKERIGNAGLLVNGSEIEFIELIKGEDN